MVGALADDVFRKCTLMPMSGRGWKDAHVPELNEAEVALLLMKHWDVLGVQDIDTQPEHEYRHEATRVLALLRRGSDVADVAAYLDEASASLHAAPNVERDQLAAQAVWDAHTG